MRDALYKDVVARAGSPGGPTPCAPAGPPSAWCSPGSACSATVALAWFTTYGLLGLAVIIAGAALAVGGQYMPAKTAKGAAALAHTLGFRDYLASGELGDDVPAAQRVELFSRYLPYAVVFDSVDRWAARGRLGTGNGEQADNLYWYHGPAEWDLSKFAGSMRTFTLTTSGAISASRQFRSLLGVGHPPGRSRRVPGPPDSAIHPAPAGRGPPAAEAELSDRAAAAEQGAVASWSARRPPGRARAAPRR